MMVQVIDPFFLARAYPDLANLPPWKRVVMWLKFGKQEGRFATFSECQQELNRLGISEFSLDSYLLANSDLSSVVHTVEHAVVHFLTQGIVENRSYRPEGSRSDKTIGSSSAHNTKLISDNWQLTLQTAEDSCANLYLLGRFREWKPGEVNGAFFESPEFLDIWNPWTSLTNEEFLLEVFSRIARRTPESLEFDRLVSALDTQVLTRLRVIRDLLETQTARPNAVLDPEKIVAGERRSPKHYPTHEQQIEISDRHEWTLLGTRERITALCWRSGYYSRNPLTPDVLTAKNRLVSLGEQTSAVKQSSGSSRSEPTCSVLVSAYNSVEYVETFCRALKSQTIFSNVEVIVVDACSTDGTAAALQRHLGDEPNVRFLEVDRRLSVYEAWNLGISFSESELLTNWNLDDTRHSKSLETQVGFLSDNPDVDVCYQDVWVSFDANLSFDAIVAAGLLDVMPPISPRTLMASNYVHNGPMWRRRLHSNGVFDTSLISAADWDFWLRCVNDGVRFAKCPIPTVAYFVNPTGVSTKPNTEGVEEADIVRSRFSESLRYPHVKLHGVQVEQGKFVNRRAQFGAQVVTDWASARRRSEEQNA